MKPDIQPAKTESLGEYLRRLRELACEAQGKTVSLDTIASKTRRFPEPQQFTRAWLSKAENDGYKQVGGDRLRTLADIYSKLLRAEVPVEWLLEKAGYTVTQSIPSQTPQENSELDDLLRNNDVLVLLDIVGQLIETGNSDDVRLLIASAQRFLNARDPKAKPGDLFDDKALSGHVRKYMEALGLS